MFRSLCARNYFERLIGRRTIVPDDQAELSYARSNGVPAFQALEKEKKTCIWLKKDIILTTFVENRLPKLIVRQYIDFLVRIIGEKLILQRNAIRDKFMQLGSNYDKTTSLISIINFGT